MRMNVDINRIICPDFIEDILDSCTDYHDELLLVDLYMNLPPFQVKDLPFWRFVLIHLKFIIILIESACPSLLLPNLDILI